ncbi:MAG: hypothetical protein JRH00_15995 [Deltaproteobacteria bacterium]|nr:hypothetical protein [Deltaproteobacteria bacterium]
MGKDRLTRYSVCCRRLVGFMLFIIAFTVWTVPALAHRVNVFAWVEGDRVFTESKFSGGRQVKGGEVIVFDLKGKELLRGKTDDRGAFSFKIPKRTAMKIVLQAGTGHRGEWTIPLGELGGGPGLGPEQEVLKNERTATAQKDPEGSSADLEQIRRVVEQCLDQRLRPVMKLLAESLNQGPTFRDIVGGMGYILGLVGIAAYFNYRRKSVDHSGKAEE